MNTVLKEHTGGGGQRVSFLLGVMSEEVPVGLEIIESTG
jgi:hypothetical protein